MGQNDSFNSVNRLSPLGLIIFPSFFSGFSSHSPTFLLNTNLMLESVCRLTTLYFFSRQVFLYTFSVTDVLIWWCNPLGAAE